LTQRYNGDLENVSDCVQSATAITADLEARTNRLYTIAGRVFGRWIRTVCTREGAGLPDTGGLNNQQ